MEQTIGNYVQSISFQLFTLQVSLLFIVRAL